MRISKIRLAGFKSFVDPTALMLPGNLTGIVGPNGCGKSNIIDAVLWVMGESSARYLRGDSMADVIFNGSNSRKPVGQAVVELIFDNSAATLGGQYGSYAELSIKRQLNREGISVYYLNGARCRRRDITDMFLGTGLGSGRYSIIAQGTIARVIEARPEELRVFLEEAAGISKYKERRRETENRLQHTRENLTRLNDICNELDRQLNHLHKQAKTAERFQRLKAQERRLKADLIAIARRRLLTEAEEQRRLIRERETLLEAALAQLREIEAGIEKEREAQAALSEHLNQAQRKYYAIGAEIVSLEQRMQHARERRQLLGRDLAQAIQDLTEADAHLSRSRLDLACLTKGIQEAEPEQGRLVEEEQAAYRQLTESEEIMQAWQAEWDEFNHKAAESLRNERGELTRLEHLERSATDLGKRLSSLRAEREALAPGALETTIKTLEEGLAEAQWAHQTLLEERERRQGRIRQARGEIAAFEGQLHEYRREQQTLQGRLASLEALQQSALHRDQGPSAEWLKNNGLAERPPLAQEMAVAPGWETALETVLGVFLEAIEVQGFESITASLPALTHGRLAVIDSHGASAPCLASGRALGEGLASKVSSSCPIEGLLAGIYAVETLDEAWALRPELLACESAITRDGTWVGANWLQVSRELDPQAGILHREQEIKGLKHRTQTLQSSLTEAMNRFERARETLERLEQEESQFQSRLVSAQEELASLRSELAAKGAQWEQIQLRKQRIETELMELCVQEAIKQDELESVRASLESIRRELGILDERRSAFTARRDQLHERVNHAREEWRRLQDQSHQLALRLESLRSQRASASQTLMRNETLAGQLKARSSELRAALAGGEAPLEEIKQQLEQGLIERSSAETELGLARAQSQAHEAMLREREGQRGDSEQKLQALRDELERARLEAEAIRVRLQAQEEQLGSLRIDMNELLAELPAEAEKEVWEERLTEVAQRIARLGAINLAAIDEYRELLQRKTYLDSQHADLSEAVATLEKAIRRIDKETETRFKETFDRVNAGLQAMFQTLFEGGDAYLELTGEDLLEAGVSIIARPPGKRNSTIHLLSGGEKALTALALVFAIFELNPSPFCLLDEVDAPLDDANVARLCRMLKSMANRVQFLIVTHNKITMEIAERLIGVTMQEPGVSRLVAVDIDEAVEMAATG